MLVPPFPSPPFCLKQHIAFPILEQRDIRSIGANRRKSDLITLNERIPRTMLCAMDLVITRMVGADGRVRRQRIKQTVAYKCRHYQHYVSRCLQVLILAANALGWIEPDFARLL